MNAQSDHKDENGLIFNIQKFSVHDGEGIRTLIFLKGCPLKCKWCSNPEGQSYSPELAYKPDKCVGVAECDGCRQACKAGAIREGERGKAEIDRTLCTDCGDCVEACPSRALELFGRHMTVDEVIRLVEEDGAFYARSGGGLTLSGGEPVAQASFVVKLLEKARSRGIDTALETSGLCDWKDLERVCAHVNQVFYDIKSLDPNKHRADVGVDNAPILENLRKLLRRFSGLNVIVRTPVVPGFNDAEDDVRAIAEFLDGLPRAPAYELLAYHRFGEPKYRQLGKDYPLPDLEPPSKEHMQTLRRAIEEARNSTGIRAGRSTGD